jgi:single-strand DNA-binding protein
MYQQIIITGHLGGDPTLRYTPDGRPVANFSVAVSRKWNDANGELQQETCWLRVADFRTAEPTAQYLAKGRQVQVIGRLRPDPNTGGPRIFTRQDGTVGASYEVIADRVIFLGSGSAEDGEESDLPPDANVDPPEEDVPF